MKTIRRMLLSAAVALSALAQAANAQEKPAAPAPRPAGPQKIVAQGVEIEFTIDPAGGREEGAAPLLEEQDARIRFRVTDTTTGTPLSGVKPSAWLTRRQGETTGAEVCKERVSSFLQGSLRARPEVDLNAYYILTLNEEPNISVIDPLLGFGGTKLVTLVFLRSPGQDWVITADQERLFVSMPASNQVAVVDTNTWKVVANVETGARPVRLALQPDEKYLWVGTEEGAESGVTVIDTATLKPAARVPTGAGRHEIALSGDNRLAYVTNRDAGTLSVIDAQKLSKVADVKVGRRADAAAVSPLSKSVYVTDGAAGQVVVVDGAAARVLGSLAVREGAGRVRFAPGGRYGFVPSPADGAVYVFDASTNRVLHAVPVGKGPDQIAFTDEYAYVRSAGSLDVSMIRLSTVGKEPHVEHFPAGQSAPARSATAPADADSIVPSPEPNSVIVANLADKQIYYYTEGMAAPMGTFQNYKRDPRAVLVADRSLREVKSGTYETFARLPRSGTYDVAFLLDSPRVTHCFEARAGVNPAVKRERAVALGVEYLDRAKPLRVGEEYRLRFRLTETATGKPADGLKDVQVLTFLSPGLWQKREWAQPVGGGVYELKLTVPQEGVYMFFVASRAAGVEFRQLPSLMLRAEQTADPERAKSE
jgi:YVTN family beta-propeller protein